MFQKEFFHSDAIEEQFLVSQSEHFLKITFFSLCEEHFKHLKKKLKKKLFFFHYKEYFVQLVHFINPSEAIQYLVSETHPN